jgi:hypothetical protein
LLAAALRSCGDEAASGGGPIVLNLAFLIIGQGELP